MSGASGDRQFRMYVRLKADALDRLERSREFKRGVDNTVYHKGYPINYREQGGAPSIQISIAPDQRRADIDVDYRSSGFPRLDVQRPSDRVQLRRARRQQFRPPFRIAGPVSRTGGATSSASGWSATPATAEKASALAIPRTPRAGKKNIDVMVARLPERVARRGRRRGGDGLRLRSRLRVPGPGQRRPVGLRSRHGAVSAPDAT